MWQFFDDTILFVPDGSNMFEWVAFLVDTWKFSGEIVTIPSSEKAWEGYDNWVQQFDPENEITLLKEIIQKAENNPSYRCHLRGISCAKSAEILREYYKKKGYEDALAKNYTLPNTVQVIASISLRHALWSEKDKKFLHTRDKNHTPYGMTTPPIRGSHDLRILQQALRMNIILGIEVFPGDETHINTLIEEEILSPFSVSQMIRFRWKKYEYSL